MKHIKLFYVAAAATCLFSATASAEITRVWGAACLPQEPEDAALSDRQFVRYENRSFDEKIDVTCPFPRSAFTDDPEWEIAFESRVDFEPGFGLFCVATVVDGEGSFFQQDSDEQSSATDERLSGDFDLTEDISNNFSYGLRCDIPARGSINTIRIDD